ncbi:MAG: O-antigen ligase family protein [Candidatus Sericytochromatia bacterium]|nr:O-antigen ligase family protein [Candidatus Sericytochromatia bacterium]
MFFQRNAGPRSPLKVHLLALILVIATSGALLLILSGGLPDRRTMALLLGVLVLTPALIRWQLGWSALFLTVPWIAWFRRVQTEINPGVELISGFDWLLVMPDMLTAAALMGYVFTQRLRPKIDPVPGEKALLALLTAFIVWCIFEIFNPWMGSIAAGLNGLRVFTLYMGLYWLTAYVCQEEHRVYGWLRVTLIMVALTGLYGIYQFVVGLPEYDMRWAEASKASAQMIGENIRIFSTFSFTSTFSHFMVVGALMAWGVLGLRRVSRLVVLLAPLIGGIALLALALTFVRSAFVALFVSGVAGLLLSAGPQKRLTRLILLATFASLLLLLNPGSSGDVAQIERAAPENAAVSELVTDRVLSIAQGTGNSSVNYRLGLWRTQFEFITLTAPMGLGMGVGAGQRFGGNGFAASMAYTESQYVTQLVELGWIGFLLFLALTLYALVYTLRVHDSLEDRDHRLVVRIAFMVQVALLITGITGGAVLSVQPGAIYYWSAMGLVTAVARNAQKRRLDSSLPAPSV